MKPKWLDRNISAKGPYLTLCMSPAELTDVCKRLGVAPEPWPESHARTITFERKGHSPACVVTLTTEWPKYTGIQIAGILVHEAVHVWQQHLRDIGEHNPSAEMEAYGIQNISQTLMEEFARRTA